MKCETCERTKEKLYWWRRFPTIYLCKECWVNFEYFEESLYRISLARVIKNLRKTKTGRKKAKALFNTLNGTGVPSNLKRRKHGIQS